MPQFFIIIPLLNVIAAIGLIIYIIVRHNKQPVRSISVLLVLSVGIWSFGYWQWLESDTYASALFWVRVLSVGSTLIPVFFLHWVIKFFNHSKRYAELLRFAYFVTLIFLIFGFTEYFVAGVSTVGVFEFWPQAGPLYHFYILISYIGFLGYGLYLLWKHYSKEGSVMRPKYRIILMGMAISIIGGFTNFPAWYGINFPV